MPERLQTVDRSRADSPLHKTSVVMKSCGASVRTEAVRAGVELARTMRG